MRHRSTTDRMRGSILPVMGDALAILILVVGFGALVGALALLAALMPTSEERA